MAFSQLQALLKQYGLESLYKWAESAIVNNLSEAEIELELYDQPEFKARFPAIFAREKAGMSPMSPAEYLEYETTAMQMARAFGVKLTRQEIDANIANDRSVSELQDVIGLASQAVHMASGVWREQFERLYSAYGVTDDDMVRYFLNPKESAAVMQRRFAALSISEQAFRSGWGQLSTTQAEELARTGMDAGAAAQGFSSLVESEELFEAVDETEQDIGTEDQLSLLTGNVDLAKQVEQRGQKRAAKFQEGGGFATGGTGVTGLGSASTK